MNTQLINALDLPTEGGFHAESVPTLATIVTTTATTCITSAFGYSDHDAVQASVDAPEGASAADLIAARERALG